jgi:hypothetical protein
VTVPDRSKIYDWYAAYFVVLEQVGLVVQSRQFATYQASRRMKRCSAWRPTLLGEAPAAVAVVKATLDALKTMSADSPWMTIFNRKSQSGQAAHFQVALAERDDKGQFLVNLMAFGLQARSTLTQILFFKIQTSEDVIKSHSRKGHDRRRHLVGGARRNQTTDRRARTRLREKPAGSQGPAACQAAAAGRPGEHVTTVGEVARRRRGRDARRRHRLSRRVGRWPSSRTGAGVDRVAAIEQFHTVKLPDLIRGMYRALNNLDLIHPHCRALPSLTFNRRPPFS